SCVGDPSKLVSGISKKLSAACLRDTLFLSELACGRSKSVQNAWLNRYAFFLDSKLKFRRIAMGNRPEMLALEVQQGSLVIAWGLVSRAGLVPFVTEVCLECPNRSSGRRYHDLQGRRDRERGQHFPARGRRRGRRNSSGGRTRVAGGLSKARR